MVTTTAPPEIPELFCEKEPVKITAGFDRNLTDKFGGGSLVVLTGSTILLTDCIEMMKTVDCIASANLD